LLVFDPMKCPHCGSLDLRNRPRRNAFYPVAYAVVLGVHFAQVHQASAPREYDCRACGRAGSRRSTPARIAFALLILWGAWIALALVVGLLWLMLR
jgi:hypothetical protein